MCQFYLEKSQNFIISVLSGYLPCLSESVTAYEEVVTWKNQH